MGAAVLKIRHLYIGEQLHSDSTSLNSVNINAYPLPIQNIVLILSCKTKIAQVAEWQTRSFQVRVLRGVQVRVLFWAPQKRDNSLKHQQLSRFYFILRAYYVQMVSTEVRRSPSPRTSTGGSAHYFSELLPFPFAFALRAFIVSRYARSTGDSSRTWNRRYSCSAFSIAC